MVGPQEKKRHTPGPWEYFHGQLCFGVPEERRVICSPGLQGVPEADCLLMAAAPDLLQACEFFKKWMLCGQPSPYTDSQILEVVERAIKKASSET